MRTTHALLGTALGLGLGVGCAALFPLPAQAAVIPVGCTESALVTAIEAANLTPQEPDSLTLAADCIYPLTIAHGGADTGLPVISTPIDLVGPATITRSSVLFFRIAEVSATGTLTLDPGVSLTNGNVNGYGGGILNSGTVTLGGSTLSGNVATLGGGGLANLAVPPGSPATVTFNGGSLLNNTSGHRGGGIFNGPGGTLTATGLTISGNAARRGGGLAAIGSVATSLTSTSVTGNAADVTGGGIFRNAGVMTVSTSTITGNGPNNCVGRTAVPTCVG